VAGIGEQCQRAGKQIACDFDHHEQARIDRGQANPTLVVDRMGMAVRRSGVVVVSGHGSTVSTRASADS